MIKQYVRFLALVFLLMILGCKKDTTEVSVYFQLVYDGEPMIMQQEYLYPGGKTFIATKVSMYLSDLSIASNNESVVIDDVRFVNLTESHRTAKLAAQGLLLYQEDLEMDGVKNLRFNIGLTEEQNKTVPADYPSGHPLAMPGEYWLAWDSYIFFKIEGKIDLDEDGIAEAGVALHLGSDQVMRSFDLINLSGGNHLTVEIDVTKIFGTDKVYDITENPQIHSLSQMPALLELSNNLTTAVSLKSQS
ncbi:MAG: hypothetical protein HKN76_13915 [Saprospiraceae bacterium]|nr:hypothetical protein [Saprospiraceae bacterium]